MSNLLPQEPQKKMRSEVRARFLLAASIVLFCCAALFSLALAPAEVSLVFFPTAPAQGAQDATSSAADGAAIAQTKALLAALQPFSATTSLSDVSAALADRGQGITIDDIAYSISSHSLTLGGHAQTPDDLNAFREALQNDPDFSGVSVPVSALLGSGGGGFTITMNAQ